jgi:hypothetical protein
MRLRSATMARAITGSRSAAFVEPRLVGPTPRDDPASPSHAFYGSDDRIRWRRHVKTTILVLMVAVCGLAMGGCAGLNAQYEEAVAKGLVPYCDQHPMEFSCMNARQGH